MQNELNGARQNTIRHSTLVVLGAALLGGCAMQPSGIAPTPVTLDSYRSFSCEQLKMEVDWVNQRIIAVSGKQQLLAVKDAVTLGAAYFFWPALALLQGPDRSEEVGRLKGEFEAIEATATEKDCDIGRELRKARTLQTQQQTQLLPLPAAMTTDARAPDGPVGMGDGSQARR